MIPFVGGSSAESRAATPEPELISVPPFRAGSKCPACGAPDRDDRRMRLTTYDRGGSRIGGDPLVLVPHLRRTCQRCGYATAELPLDIEPCAPFIPTGKGAKRAPKARPKRGAKP